MTTDCIIQFIAKLKWSLNICVHNTVERRIGCCHTLSVVCHTHPVVTYCHSHSLGVSFFLRIRSQPAANELSQFTGVRCRPLDLI